MTEQFAIWSPLRINPEWVKVRDEVNLLHGFVLHGFYYDTQVEADKAKNLLCPDVKPIYLVSTIDGLCNVKMVDGYDACEWNPLGDKLAREDDPYHGPATFIVGSARNNYHICDQCLQLKRFRRFKRISRLQPFPNHLIN